MAGARRLRDGWAARQPFACPDSRPAATAEIPLDTVCDVVGRVLEPGVGQRVVRFAAHRIAGCLEGRVVARCVPAARPGDTAAATDAASEARVHRFAFEREHAEHAFVHAVQRFVFDEAV